jgi:hypothetical protein
MGPKCRERERERVPCPVDRVVNPASRSPRVATVQVLCRRVAVLFYPCVLYFASRRGRRALISAVWQSRSIFNVAPRHSAMMEVWPPRRDDVVVFHPLIRTVR